jgi:hypothetical protein
MILLCLHFASVCVCRFFRVSDSVFRIRDPGSGSFSTPGFEMGKIRIREGKIRIQDKHPGSATLADINAASSLLLGEESLLCP